MVAQWDSILTRLTNLQRLNWHLAAVPSATFLMPKLQWLSLNLSSAVVSEWAPTVRHAFQCLGSIQSMRTVNIWRGLRVSLAGSEDRALSSLQQLLGPVELVDGQPRWPSKNDRSMTDTAEGIAMCPAWSATLGY